MFAEVSSTNAARRQHHRPDVCDPNIPMAPEMTGRVSSAKDDLQHYGGGVEVVVLLSRHCNSELIGALASSVILGEVAVASMPRVALVVRHKACVTRADAADGDFGVAGWCLEHDFAAGDVECDASDPCGGVGGEEQGCCGDVVGLADPPERE